MFVDCVGFFDCFKFVLFCLFDFDDWFELDVCCFTVGWWFALNADLRLALICLLLCMLVIWIVVVCFCWFCLNRGLFC